MAFDPDKYLAKSGASSGFDPDVYLGKSSQKTYKDPIPSIFPTSWQEDASQAAGDLIASIPGGASEIGATLIAPFEAALAGTGQTGAREARGKRVERVEEGLRLMGADTDSGTYKTGKFATEVAGTLGTGGALANVLRKVVPQAPRLAQAIESWGMLAPRAAGSSKAADVAYKAAGGAIPGAAAAGLLNPDVEQAGIGAAIGATVPFAGPAAGKLIDAVIQKGQQVAGGAQGQAIEWLRKTFPDNWQEVASRLKDLKPYLPFEKPTIAAAAPGFSGKLSAIEQGARATPEMADEFFRRDAANQAARLEAAQRRADPLETLIQSRADVTAPLYAAARAEQVPMDDTIRTIMQGPEVSRALNAMTDTMRQGQVNAAVAGREVQPTIIGRRPAPVTDYVNEWAVPVGPTPEKIQIEAAEKWKRAIDAELNSFNKKAPSPLGLGNINAEQLRVARNQLTQWINQASPRIAEARAEFASRSPQVNQAQFFGDVVNALDRPISAEGLSQLNTIVKDLPRAFTRSTGIARYEKPEEVLASMSPLARRTLEGIYRSAQREVAGAQASTGQASLPRMEGVLSSIEHRVPTWFSPAITAVRNIAKRMGADTDDAAMELINKASIDPQAFARLIEMTPPTQRSAVMNGIRRYAAQNQSMITAFPVAASDE